MLVLIVGGLTAFVTLPCLHGDDLVRNRLVYSRLLDRRVLYAHACSSRRCSKWIKNF